jgi:hypothetical protein
MNRIKVIGLVIIILLSSLIYLSQNISNNNHKINIFKDIINSQKTSTQNIAKEVLYIYKNRDSDTVSLNTSLTKFMQSFHKIEPKLIKQKSKEFYSKVSIFKEQIKNKTPYSNIILDKTVQEIYYANLELITHFDKLIKDREMKCNQKLDLRKIIQYSIFILLFVLFIYLIIYILRGRTHFEVLIGKIETSISSIDQIEQNVEKYLNDNQHIKDEEIIIESLEELMNSSIRLKQLQAKLTSK